MPAASPFGGDARRLLYVGRLVPVKCADLVVRSLARLPKDVHLTVVGDGPERGGLERLAGELGVKERIRFAGWVAQKETGRFYAEAGAFVFPSVRESTGAVILEAMSYGLPVIGVDFGGPAQFLSGGRGILLPVESPAQLEGSLSDAVRRLLCDPVLSREIGMAGRRRVADEYLWPQKAEILLGMYEEVLEAPRRQKEVLEKGVGGNRRGERGRWLGVGTGGL